MLPAALLAAAEDANKNETYDGRQHQRQEKAVSNGLAERGESKEEDAEKDGMEDAFTEFSHGHILPQPDGERPGIIAERTGWQRRLSPKTDCPMRSDDYRAGDEAMHSRVQEIYRGLYGTDPVGPAAEHG